MKVGNVVNICCFCYWEFFCCLFIYFSKMVVYVSINGIERIVMYKFIIIIFVGLVIV